MLGDFIMEQTKIKVIEDIFDVHKALTISELAQHLNCAEITARRKLHQVGYFSSYTHNSQYYTLQTIAKFNTDGIWSYNDIHFSKFGTLKNTMLHLVDTSRSGLTVSELSEKLKIKCYSTLNLFYKNGYFNRIHYKKDYVYLSKDNEIYQKQYSYYFREINPQIAIQLLVEFINHDLNISHQMLCTKLQQAGFEITVKEIEQFLIDIDNINDKQAPDISVNSTKNAIFDSDKLSDKHQESLREFEYLTNDTKLKN